MSDIQKATEAQTILDSEVFNNAFAFVLSQTLGAIPLTKPKEIEERERLYMAVKVLEHAKQFLILTIQNGESEKIAKEQTDKIQTLGKSKWI